MKWGKSIRWRIQAWHGALLLVVFIGFCISAYRLERSNVRRNGDRDLEIRLAAMSEALGGGDGHGQQREGPQNGPPPGRPGRDGPREPEAQEESGPARPPPGFAAERFLKMFESSREEPFYYVVWNRATTRIAASSAAPPGVPRPVRADYRQSGVEFRDRDGVREAFMFTPPGECLLAGRSQVGFENEMRRFAWKLAGISAAVLGVGLAIGWWIASRAMRPISQISAAATRIAAGHLNERIHTDETDSELGKLAMLLDETFQRLDAAFDEQARFTSDAAHELRTPVSIILGQAQLALARERSSEDYRATIAICQRAAKRMHGLIESLLDLAVLDASPTSSGQVECDLAELAGQHLALMHDLADEEGITLTGHLESASCRANPDRLAQILDNLLSNALKFSPAGSEVHLRTWVEDGHCCLSVRDTGPGIAAEHLPHLFERFYRADTSRNRATGGAGLGLAICQRIAEAHGGSLSVESQPGTGSCFTLRLPKAG